MTERILESVDAPLSIDAVAAALLAEKRAACALPSRALLLTPADYWGLLGTPAVRWQSFLGLEAVSEGCPFQWDGSGRSLLVRWTLSDSGTPVVVLDESGEALSLGSVYASNLNRRLVLLHHRKSWLASLLWELRLHHETGALELPEVAVPDCPADVDAAWWDSLRLYWRCRIGLIRLSEYTGAEPVPLEARLSREWLCAWNGALPAHPFTLARQRQAEWQARVFLRQSVASGLLAKRWNGPIERGNPTPTYLPTLIP